MTVIARPAATPYKPSGPGAQAPVYYRPLYNVQPLQRVPARVPQQQQAPSGYRQPPYLSSAYNDFIKGLAAGYYGNRRPGSGPANRPTPVIQQDEPVSVESSETPSSPTVRTPKTRREAKKVKKNNKKVTDPLQILKKINRKQA